MSLKSIFPDLGSTFTRAGILSPWSASGLQAGRTRTGPESCTQAGFSPVEYLAGLFNALEINTSFYGPPRAETTQKWTEQVAGNKRFRFTAKLWRGFTHERSTTAEDEKLAKNGLTPVRVCLQTAAKTFEELIPGDMHARFSNTMLVSQSSDAKGGLFERTDDYDVYLKPHNADNGAILRKTKYPGKPPLWIPMPRIEV